MAEHAPPVDAAPPSPELDAPLAAATGAIVTQHLTKQYGSLAAVNDMTLTVPYGSVFGLIGPNGAGKSTLMSMAATLLLPSSGSIEVMGHDPVKKPEEVRRSVGYMPDGLGVYEGDSVRQYLSFFMAAYRTPRDERPKLMESLLELVDLEVKIDAPVNTLSRGMKQRLSLARALVHQPDLLILDEPASGLDPRARVELRDLIVTLHAMGKTILVSSHILSELAEICTHVGIIEAGRLLAAGSPAEIRRSSVASRLVQPPPPSDSDPKHAAPPAAVTEAPTIGEGDVVITVRFGDGTVERHLVADAEAQMALLKRLVSEDPRGVLEFTDSTSDLEDVFLTVTKGVVQ